MHASRSFQPPTPEPAQHPRGARFPSPLLELPGAGNQPRGHPGRARFPGRPPRAGQADRTAARHTRSSSRTCRASGSPRRSPRPRGSRSRHTTSPGTPRSSTRCAGSWNSARKPSCWGTPSAASSPPPTWPSTPRRLPSWCSSTRSASPRSRATRRSCPGVASLYYRAGAALPAKTRRGAAALAPHHRRDKPGDAEVQGPRHARLRL